MKVIGFEQNHCKKIRSYLDSYLSNELMVETNHEVLKHVDSCHGCADALASRSRVKQVLRHAVMQDEAPAGLRYRIQKDIRKSPAAVRWGQWALVAAAAVVLMAGAFGVVRFAGSRGGQTRNERAATAQTAELLTIGLNDHSFCAIDHNLASRRFTREEMSQKMGPEFAGLVDLVEQKAPGEYEVVVGHRCQFAGRQFIHLILRNQETVISLAITRKNSESFPADAVANALKASGVSLYDSRIQNYEVTGFETRDYLAFIVSNLPKEDNVRIASNLAPGVRDFLTKLEG
ncbi:MAG TPA: zf-HC2 domain-containing protein [Blastocatellia bacterium]|nr:zf-HC2 domain-containing protein [Blastocatellia bacterium]